MRRGGGSGSRCRRRGCGALRCGLVFDADDFDRGRRRNPEIAFSLAGGIAADDVAVDVNSAVGSTTIPDPSTPRTSLPTIVLSPLLTRIPTSSGSRTSLSAIVLAGVYVAKGADADLSAFDEVAGDLGAELGVLDAGPAVHAQHVAGEQGAVFRVGETFRGGEHLVGRRRHGVAFAVDPEGVADHFRRDAAVDIDPDTVPPAK